MVDAPTCVLRTKRFLRPHDLALSANLLVFLLRTLSGLWTLSLHVSPGPMYIDSHPKLVNSLQRKKYGDLSKRLCCTELQCTDATASLLLTWGQIPQLAAGCPLLQAMKVGGAFHIWEALVQPQAWRIETANPTEHWHSIPKNETRKPLPNPVRTSFSFCFMTFFSFCEAQPQVFNFITKMHGSEPFPRSGTCTSSICHSACAGEGKCQCNDLPCILHVSSCFIMFHHFVHHVSSFFAICSSPFIMFHNVCQCFIMFHHFLQFVHDSSSCFIIFANYSSFFAMCSSLFIMFHHLCQFFIIVHHVSSLLPMFYHGSPFLPVSTFFTEFWPNQSTNWANNFGDNTTAWGVQKGIVTVGHHGIPVPKLDPSADLNGWCRWTKGVSNINPPRNTIPKCDNKP